VFLLCLGSVYLLWEGISASGQSYTYNEARMICQSDGGSLATETQLIDRLERDVSRASCCGCGQINFIKGCSSIAI